MNDNLHAAVLWFAYAWTGGHQQVGVTEALRSNRVFWHTIANQFGLHRVGTADRQRPMLYFGVPEVSV